MFSSVTPSTTAPATGERWSPKLWGALVVLCGALFLDGLDISMVGVALPSIRHDLGLSTSSLQWIVSGYVLGYGGLLLLGGRTADLLGRRRVFLIALAAFAVASLLGGLVSDPTLLIATRFIKGVGAAFTAPAGLSIITTTFAEGSARNRALSIYTACGASGFSLGLVLSGLLTEVGWRWTFLLPVPIALIALVAGLRLIPREHAEDRAVGGYDVAGAVTATAAMLLLVYAVVQAPSVGWLSAQTVISFVVVIALLVSFVIIERRTAHPLVRLGILRSGTLVRANLGAVIFFGSYVGFQFVVTQYMQTLLGWTALQTALAFLPAALIVAFASTKMGSLVDRVGTGRLIFVGFVALVAAYALFLRAGDAPSYAAVILPSMLLLGISCALTFSSLNIQATDGVADDEQGLASGLVNTSMQIGGAVVLAITTAVVTANAGEGTTGPAALSAGVHPALAVVTGIAVIGALVSLFGLRRRRAAQAAVPAGSVEDAVPVSAG
ncbi:MFS transporter [Solihabitans fulvus]|uniref:MFS transporter n=1 Tax=Solihabitans fulvus TaxID=1892852 RepID=A0A5B2XV02_9PSEU|nr:MFS transporter [Solihabitans fulvus]KAA2266624.1 MFS transporter [Solihabitans fulvus]